MADANSTVKLCECGCGQPTWVANYTNESLGYSMGSARRFVQGHHMRAKRLSSPLRYHKMWDGSENRAAHIVIAERALSKPLPDGAEVHHFDGNRHNNAHANLVICQDHSYHSLLHARQRVRVAGGDPNTQRICSRCRVVKFLHEYRTSASGVDTYCRVCRNHKKREEYHRTQRSRETRS